MGLAIREDKDFDLALLLKHAPKKRSALRMRAILQGARISISRKNSNACVMHVEGERPQIFINPDFIERYVDNYYELFLLVFHEMTHIVVGHFIEAKIDLLYGDAFWSTRDGKRIKHMADELLIKHIENVALPEDEYHTINEKVFRALPEPMNIFFRGTPAEEISDLFFLQLQNRVYSAFDYSAREAASSLRRKYDLDAESPPPPSSNPWENVESNPDDSGSGDSDPSEDTSDNSEQEKEDSPAGEDSSGETDESPPEETSEDDAEDKEHSSKSTADEAGLEKIMEALAEITSGSEGSLGEIEELLRPHRPKKPEQKK